MTGGMVIGSYALSKTTAGSILMIQGIIQSMTMTWFNQRITCGQTTQKAKHGERLRTGKATHTVLCFWLCCNCYTSGPNNMRCIDGCGTGEYKTVQYGNYTFDCQTIAEKLGKHHTIAMAGCKQKWLRTTCNRFDIQMIRGRIETKHKHIEDAEERNRTIKQEYEDFLEDYECIVFGH
jgi:hypothetical protein